SRKGPLRRPDPTSSARIRLALVLAVLLVGLGLAWVAVEVVQNLRITLFQPFRMATVARGVALVGLADHVLRLWRRDRFTDRARAAILSAGLVGDWAMVVATTVELSSLGVEWMTTWRKREVDAQWAVPLVGGIVLVSGLFFLMRHDTASGHLVLLAALVVTAI